ncbi:MAG: CapA family protein [bacterium]|nr:CapA family protein [bacterium]
MQRAFGLAITLTLVAAFLFVLAERYVLHIQSVTNYAWPARVKTASIVFGGDMMFDRSIRTAIEKRTQKQGGLPAEALAQAGDFIFSCIDPVLADADLVVANLEGPITEHASISASSVPGDASNFTFTFPTSTSALLNSHNIRMVNLGNNHILNFGRVGAKVTAQFLKDADIGYFGQPTVISSKALAQVGAAACPFEASCEGWAKGGGELMRTVSTKIIHGIPLAFINYNEFAPAEHSNILENVGMSSTTIFQIQNARASGYIPIVYTHWGVEYATTSSAYSRELAHRFIEAGAEIVIGSHPHVVQEHEVYNGKRIYYSLGNFIFDQYFSDDVTHGLLLKVAFNQSGVQLVKEIPIELERDRRTCLAL